MTRVHPAYSTPNFDPSDPMVCRTLTLRPSIWTVVFNELQKLGKDWSWSQDDPANATVQTVIQEINDATDLSVIARCYMLGNVEWIAREPYAFELLCDGAQYERVDYPDLYEVLQTAYIVDADNFTVPDMISKTVRGSAVAGTQGGQDTIQPSVAQLPTHNHTYDKTVVAASVVLGELAGFELGDHASTNTGNAGDGDPIDITNVYETLTPVIIAKFPTTG